MTPNALKTAWAAGRPTLNGWLQIASPLAAEIMAEQGYDSLTVDLQHGVVDYADAVTMLQAIRARGAVPMARVPWLDPGAIMKMLDAGAYGIICPMISTRAEAERLVSYMRYPPHGTRSFGPARAALVSGGGYFEAANTELVCFAMIETAEAVANIDEIVATPGLDGIYIGPVDLTLGVTGGRLAPGFDRQEPEMVEVITRIVGAAKTAGIRAGIHCGTPEYAARAAGWGFDFATVGSDIRFLTAGAEASVAACRLALGERAEPAREGADSVY